MNLETCPHCKGKNISSQEIEADRLKWLLGIGFLPDGTGDKTPLTIHRCEDCKYVLDDPIEHVTWYAQPTGLIQDPTIADCMFCGRGEHGLDKITRIEHRTSAMEEEETDLFYVVVCGMADCEAAGPHGKTPDEAVEKWNSASRAGPTNQRN